MQLASYLALTKVVHAASLISCHMQRAHRHKACTKHVSARLTITLTCTNIKAGGTHGHGHQACMRWLAHSSHTAAATTAAAARGPSRLYTGYKGSPKHPTHTSRHKATGGRSSSMIGAVLLYMCPCMLGTARKWMSMPTGSPQHQLQDICRRYSSTARARKQICKQ